MVENERIIVCKIENKQGIRRSVCRPSSREEKFHSEIS